MSRQGGNWAELVLLPAASLVLALGISGLVVMATGNDPVAAIGALIGGSLGSATGIGYTLFYATSLIFTGLAVATAFRCGLFNIGAEGQAILGGIGITLAVLNLEALPGALLVPVSILCGAAMGATWAAIPGWLQAHRGSHVVITTIMANFLAAILLVHLLVNHLVEPGSMAPETRRFAAQAMLPSLGFLGLPAGVPVNLALPLALAAAAGLWVLLWRTPWGFGVRVVGASPTVAAYAGIAYPPRVVAVMALSGALASGVAVNELLGSQGRLQLGFTGGAGFTGIAVALMGRNHPLGVVLAALLFGALTQGGAELAFEMPRVPSELVVLVQGLVILFTGAMGGLFRPLLARLG